MMEILKAAEQSLENGQYREAIEKVRTYTANHGYTEDAAILEGEAWLSLDQLEEARSTIEKGLGCDSGSYELYFMLGGYFERHGNHDCALICYEYAKFYCFNAEDRKLLENTICRVKSRGMQKLPKTAVVLQAGRDLKRLQLCIESIRRYNPQGSFEIIVAVDHKALTNLEWLRQEEEIKIVSSAGHSSGEVYNLCIETSENDSDILLLNAYTLLLEHTLFNLRLALYEDKYRGGVCSANQMNQSIQSKATGMGLFEDYAHKYNIPGREHELPVVFLGGAAVLLRRRTLKQCGWMDERFTDFSHQVADICFRMIQMGWFPIQCANNLAVTSGQAEESQASKEAFYTKWRVNLGYSCYARNELIQFIEPEQESFSVLEVGCSCGGTLLALKSRYPKCRLHGIELEEGPASIARHIAQVTNVDVEKGIDYPSDFFTYIIVGDVFEHLHNPEKVLRDLRRCLKKNGRIITSIPNVMHISVVRSLLEGNWTYTDAGILDRTHLRFFTAKEIIRLMAKTGFKILQMGKTQIPIVQEDEELIDKLAKIGKTEKDMFQAYQYLVIAEKV